VFRKLLVAFGFFLAVTWPSITAATATGAARTVAATKAATTLTAPLLPGEPTFASGAPAYDFGFNNGIEYSSPAFSTSPSVQAQVKAAGLTIDRVWAPYENPGTNTMSASDITWMTNHIDAAKASGATCYMELGEVDNLPLLENEVEFAEPMGCHIFEFGNEIDNNSGYSAVTYVNQWIADIPALRALSVCAGTATVSSGCLFGGPTVANPGDLDGAPSSYPSAVAYWLASSKSAGVLPDFVSWHKYPCNGAAAWASTTAAAQADCLAYATAPANDCAATNCYVSLAYGQQEVLGWEQQYLGHLLPTGISETNFDPGSATLTDWAADDIFLVQYEAATLNEFVALHFSFAMEYTAFDYAGYGDLDMFCDSAGFDNDPACTSQGAPKGQFKAIASEVQKNKGTPPPYPSCPPLTTGATCQSVMAAYETTAHTAELYYLYVIVPWVKGTHHASCYPGTTGSNCLWTAWYYYVYGAPWQQWYLTQYKPWAEYYGYSY
jgi:hypothetical protein